MKRKILYHFVHIALFTRNIFRWRYFCILNIATFCTWKQRNKWHDKKKHIQNKHMNEGIRNIVYDLKIRWKCNKPKNKYCGTNRSINQSEGTQSQALNILCECGCVCSRSFLWIISFITWSFSFFRFVSINKLLWDERNRMYDYYGLLLLSLLLIIAIEYSLEMACLFQFTEFYFGQEMKYTPVNGRCNALCQ